MENKRNSNRREKAAKLFKEATKEDDESSDSDVFDYLTEEQYKELVDKQRKQDKFIINDCEDDYLDDGDNNGLEINTKKRKSENEKSMDRKKQRLEDASKGMSKIDKLFSASTTTVKKSSKAMDDGMMVILHLDELDKLLNEIDTPVKPKKTESINKIDLNKLYPINTITKEQVKEDIAETNFEMEIEESAPKEVIKEEKPKKYNKLLESLTKDFSKPKEKKEKEQVVEKMEIVEERSETIIPKMKMTKQISFETNENDMTSFKMYWFDIYESQTNFGTLFLVGKVMEQGVFQSCCLMIKNIQRTLYVLPKEGFTYNDVVKELKEKFSKINRSEFHLSFDEVEKSYSFELPNIPRGSSKYIRVRYNTSYGTISLTEGRTFSHVFGCHTSLIEIFLLECGIKGPCWLNIVNSHHSATSFSYCGLECILDSLHSSSILPVSTKEIKQMSFVKVMEDQATSPPLKVLVTNFNFLLNGDHQELAIISYQIYENVNTASSTQLLNPNTSKTLLRTFPGKTVPEYLFNSDVKTTEEQKKKKNFFTKFGVSIFQNERIMISNFLAILVREDCDVNHNFHNLSVEVLLSRLRHYNILDWSKIGRIKRSNSLSDKKFSYYNDLLVGRIVVDTMVCARELIRQTSYTLDHLSNTLLNENEYKPIEITDMPNYYDSVDYLINLVINNNLACSLTYKLMLNLELIPLTLQITNISGNLWSSTLTGNRAGRIEYLLLHEFYKNDYILPDKVPKKIVETTKKPKYSGGLVLEPKKGLYNNYVLVLDFNSLYPSIIQEYNICYTTVVRKPIEENENEEEEIPEDPISIAKGEKLAILPSIIQYLVKRRRAVKDLMKSEKDQNKLKQYEIKQLAFKILANSMYGCLGFKASRFYAKPLAALVTAKGRKILQNTIDIAEKRGHNVIYGDTDSIMIHTNGENVSHARSVGDEIKKDVNQLYKYLEIEIDYVFKKMLLLTKKKYVALKVVGQNNGVEKLEKEMKGIDLVRRDWCQLSKDLGNKVIDQLLSDDSSEDVIEAIRKILVQVSEDMKTNQISLEKYIITKSLQKAPKDYPDAKGLPHVKVANDMLKERKTIGDIIPYVICIGEDSNFVTNAFHPLTVENSIPKKEIDIEWYIKHQLLPSISRLCDPIEGMSQALLAEFLGLDRSRYEERQKYSNDSLNVISEEDFNDCEPFVVKCPNCYAFNEFKRQSQIKSSNGVLCMNPECKTIIEWENYYNFIQLYIHKIQKQYYDSFFKCSNLDCSYQTRFLTSMKCPNPLCKGELIPLFTDRDLNKHIRYIYQLFNKETDKDDPKKLLERDGYNDILINLREILEMDVYNWIDVNNIFL